MLPTKHGAPATTEGAAQTPHGRLPPPKFLDRRSQPTEHSRAPIRTFLLDVPIRRRAKPPGIAVNGDATPARADRFCHAVTLNRPNQAGEAMRIVRPSRSFSPHPGMRHRSSTIRFGVRTSAEKVMNWIGTLSIFGYGAMLSWHAGRHLLAHWPEDPR